MSRTANMIEAQTRTLRTEMRRLTSQVALLNLSVATLAGNSFTNEPDKSGFLDTFSALSHSLQKELST